jgi:hypothetical protein
MAIRLIVDGLEAKASAITYDLDQSLITFGQNKSCHIELDHKEVSGRHFIIKHIDDSYIMLDEGSTYGTKLDGQKLISNKSYSIVDEHVIEVPGFIIKLYCDGQRPKFERTIVAARNLLDQLLDKEIKPSLCPSLKSQCQKNYHFIFNEEKSLFILGSLPDVDFVMQEQNVAGKHVSFVRDINGIMLIPLPRHQVFIDGKLIDERQILMHQTNIKIGDTKLVYQERDDDILSGNKKKPEAKKNHVNKHLQSSSNLSLDKDNSVKEKIVKPTMLRVLDQIFLFGFLITLAGVFVFLFNLI